MFQKAKRNQIKLKAVINGPSGSGKTYTAMLIGTGMIEALGRGKMAVIDTESGSASLYSGKGQFEFDVLTLSPPCSTDKYIQGIKAAEQGGYEVLLIDSATHEWLYILEQKALLDSRGGNSFMNWNKLTPEHERFKSAIQNAKLHIICTTRSKQEYAPVLSDSGRMTAVQKLGLAPIQREGFEFEFSTVFEMAMDHSAVASKDRTGMFSTTKPFTPTKETGVQFIRWLNEAESKT